jgi:regulator of replication initiation timing
MQNEFMRQQDQADQALQKALAKISNLTQQYEREVSHRAGMELKNAQLKNQLDDQKKDLQERYAKELQARKTEWEFERDTLLTMIQRDCNTAFENHRHATPSHHSTPHSHQESSPKDVNFDFDPPRSETKLSVDTATESDERTFWAQTSTNLVSPAYSEIDEVLRETEALIRSIV